jgi:hypothetical protein
MRSGIPALIAILALALGGCLPKTHTPLELDASLYSRADAGAPAIAAFAAPAQAADIELELRGEGPSYRRYALEFRSSGDNRQPDNRVRGRYLQSKSPGSRPLVIILPIWGSSSQPPRVLANHLTKGERAGDVNVLRLEGPRTLVNWDKLELAQSERAFLQEFGRGVDVYQTAVDDIRRLLRWAERRPEVDRQRIGLAGFSIGAIVGTMVMGVEEGIWRGTLVMGGGDPATILSVCPGRIQGVRRTLLRRFDWSVEHYRELIAEPLAAVDPLRFAGRVDPRRVLFVEATQDRCIPESSRRGLWEALGRPERIRIDRGHKYAFLSMTKLDGHWTTRRLSEFFLRPEPVVGGESVATSK